MDKETVRLTALLDDEIASHLAAQETFDAELARLAAALEQELAAHAATKVVATPPCCQPLLLSTPLAVNLRRATIVNLRISLRIDSPILT